MNDENTRENGKVRNSSAESTVYIFKTRRVTDVTEVVKVQRYRRYTQSDVTADPLALSDSFDTLIAATENVQHFGGFMISGVFERPKL